MRVIAANWIVVEAVIAMLVAPVAVVARSRTRNSRDGRARQMVGAVLVFVVLWGAVATMAMGAERWRPIFEAQAVVASATLAIAAISSCAAAGFSDVLDGAALSLLIAIVCGGGVFIAGAPLADASTGPLNIALLASPIVSAAAAAEIDLFRSAFLYEHSVIGHRLFAYPTWYEATAVYLTVGAVAMLIARFALRGTSQKSASRGAATPRM